VGQLAGAGIGAAAGLEAVLERRLRELVRQQQEQQQAAQLALQTRQIEGQEADRQERIRQFDINELRRVGDDNAVQTQRNAASDMAGVLAMPGMSNADKANEIMGSGLRTGSVDPIKVIEGLTKVPEKPKPVQYTYTDPKTGNKSLKFASPDSIPEGGLDLGNEPQKPSGPVDQEWVMRGGVPTPIRKGSAQPGDRPYDAVSERKQPAGEPSPYATERATRTVQSVDDLIGQVSRLTTGYGSVLANLPETAARDFAAELQTLKANIAFNELTAMREASKTGGALGQVSNVELQLLESALGALDTGQSPVNLKKQLVKIKESVQRWQAAGGKPLVTPSASHGPPDRVDELITKYLKPKP